MPEKNIHIKYLVYEFAHYSECPNKRAVPNKRAGLKFSLKLINGQTLINGQGGNFFKIK